MNSLLSKTQSTGPTSFHPLTKSHLLPHPLPLKPKLTPRSLTFPVINPPSLSAPSLPPLPRPSQILNLGRPPPSHPPISLLTRFARGRPSVTAPPPPPSGRTQLSRQAPCTAATSNIPESPSALILMPRFPLLIPQARIPGSRPLYCTGGVDVLSRHRPVRKSRKCVGGDGRCSYSRVIRLGFERPGSAAGDIRGAVVSVRACAAHPRLWGGGGGRGWGGV